MRSQVLHIGICDDEAMITTVVKEKCESMMESADVLYDITCFTDGLTLLEYDENFDLVFLDIEMPSMNGLEVAKRLRKKDKHCGIVFLTNYDEFMKQGYVVNAFRYLTKPINDRELQEALFSYIEEKNNNKPIIINTKEETELLYEQDILYIQSLGEGSAVITSDNYLICKHTMRDWLRRLSKDTFVLSHRTYIVHLKYVKKITKKHVILADNTEILVSRRHNKELKDKFYRYVDRHAYYIGANK